MLRHADQTGFLTDQPAVPVDVINGPNILEFLPFPCKKNARSNLGFDPENKSFRQEHKCNSWEYFYNKREIAKYTLLNRN